MKKFNITVEGKTYEVEVEEIGSTAAAVSRPTPASAPAAAPVKKPAAPVRAGSNEVSAPMPGTILQIKVTEGQSVKAGDVLCILEAMKLLHRRTVLLRRFMSLRGRKPLQETF